MEFSAKKVEEHKEENEKVEDDVIKRVDPKQGYEVVGTTTYRCLVTRMDKKVVWRNFDHALANLGIKREHIRTQVRENEEGKIQLEELIKLTLVNLSDIARENSNMDVLNNVKNNVVDS